MPNLTTPMPPKMTGDVKVDLASIKAWGTALIDELTYLFNNLGAENVKEAASVKAQNIDTNTAKINNAQIGSLTADKLTAGTVNTNKVKVESDDGSLTLSGSELSIKENERVRFLAGINPDSGKFKLALCNRSGIPTVTIDSNGNAIFSGKVESSAVYSSSFIGTNSLDYAEIDGGVFAKIDPTGIKMMQDKDGDRLQKFGVSVADDGTAYMVMGAGNGEGSKNINGVVYTNGAFKIEKNESYANLSLSGYKPAVTFWEDSEELWLNGEKVMINGVDINKKITDLENAISRLQ
ncbi:MAG: hypothetical protein IKV89_04470 [Clostridia bacterium]|nr:hypothetical protein [Clostridia bacterium]